MTTLTEVLTGDLDVDPHRLPRAKHRLEHHHEMAVRGLERLMTEASSILTRLRNEDANVWLYAARQSTGTAGYSNTISANSADVVAELAQITGILEALA